MDKNVIISFLEMHALLHYIYTPSSYTHAIHVYLRMRGTVNWWVVWRSLVPRLLPPNSLRMTFDPPEKRRESLVHFRT